ncbi:ATP-binding protein [Maritalea sp.]|uniref:sensor histidine kinase n=1 Tax=Maritalea sp. TaxID=2003361 RepID=UPI003EF53826
MRNLLAALFVWLKPSNRSKLGDNLNQVRTSAVEFNTRASMVIAIAALPLTLYLFASGQPKLAMVVAGATFLYSISMMIARKVGPEASIFVQAVALCLAGPFVTFLDPNTIYAGVAIVISATIYGYALGHSKTYGAGVVLALSALAAQFAILASGQRLQVETGIVSTQMLALLVIICAYVLLIVSFIELKRAISAHDQGRVRAFKHLVESVRDAVARYAPDGQLIYLSHTSETLFGCRRYELAGSGLLQRVHVLDRPKYMSAIADVGYKHEAKTIDVRIRCDREEKSEFVWVEVALSAVHERKNDEGRSEVIAIMRDITVRKSQESDLEDAKKQAETANDAKSRFLATIGHELRTPLNAVVGFSDMMINNIGGELSDDHLEYAELIKQSGTHLLDTVTMLLDMSKLEAGKFEIQTEQFSPETLVGPCFAIVKNAADKKNIKLEAKLGKYLPKILADERACRQIFINLLTNAIKFSPQDATICLDMRVIGKKISMRVIDEGIGIAQSDIDRLGEPFFQAQNGLNRQYEGTGLGLSIVRGLTELHDGDVSIRSTLGKGTEITIDLPIDGPGPEQQTGVLEELSDRQFAAEERKQRQNLHTKAG